MASRLMCVVALAGATSPFVACNHESSAPAASPSEAQTEGATGQGAAEEAPAAEPPASETEAGTPETAALERRAEETPIFAAEFDQVGAERGEATASALDTQGGTTLYLRCGDEGPSFAVRMEGEQAELSMPFGNVRLPQVESASGARYSDGKFTLWSKDDGATYQDDQGQKFECKNDPEQAVWSDARRRGVEMRAVGGERGGWVLEMTLTGTSLVFDEGEERIDITTPSPKGYLESEEESYWGRDDDEFTLLRVTRADEACTDPRTGQKFDMKIEVALNGQAMEGCGRNLRGRPYER